MEHLASNPAIPGCSGVEPSEAGGNMPYLVFENGHPVIKSVFSEEMPVDNPCPPRPKPAPLVRVYCQVCRITRSTGLNYGVKTCDSCKRFFRKTIQRGEKLFCEGKGKKDSCDITDITTRNKRKRCPKCRFAKCLQMGMNQSLVKAGRAHQVPENGPIFNSDDGSEVLMFEDLGPALANLEEFEKFFEHLVQYDAQDKSESAPPRDEPMRGPSSASGEDSEGNSVSPSSSASSFERPDGMSEVDTLTDRVMVALEVEGNQKLEDVIKNAYAVHCLGLTHGKFGPNSLGLGHLAQPTWWNPNEQEISKNPMQAFRFDAIVQNLLQLAKGITSSMRCMVEFAKSVPDFANNLKNGTQLDMVKANSLAMVLITDLFQSSTNPLTPRPPAGLSQDWELLGGLPLICFSNGFILTQDVGIKLFGSKFVKLYLATKTRAASLNLSLEAVSLMAAVTLFWPKIEEKPVRGVKIPSDSGMYEPHIKNLNAKYIMMLSNMIVGDDPWVNRCVFAGPVGQHHPTGFNLYSAIRQILEEVAEYQIMMYEALRKYKFVCTNSGFPAMFVDYMDFNVNDRL